jgi:hypothetical protein
LPKTCALGIEAAPRAVLGTTARHLVELPLPFGFGLPEEKVQPQVGKWPHFGRVIMRIEGGRKWGLAKRRLASIERAQVGEGLWLS